jgi:hypothetical protein
VEMIQAETVGDRPRRVRQRASADSARSAAAAGESATRATLTVGIADCRKSRSRHGQTFTTRTMSSSRSSSCRRRRSLTGLRAGQSGISTSTRQRRSTPPTMKRILPNERFHAHCGHPSGKPTELRRRGAARARRAAVPGLLRRAARRGRRRRDGFVRRPNGGRAHERWTGHGRARIAGSLLFSAHHISGWSKWARSAHFL